MRILKCVVAALLLTDPALAVAQESGAQDPVAQAQDPVAQEQSDPARDLLQQLHEADPSEARKVEREIALDWRRSGSPAMDLLLTRGQDALEAGEIDTAVGHFSALVDHAPEFAEGWHRRATAYYRQEEFGLALSDLGRTLTLNPDHFNALFGLAVILETLDRPEAAYRAYTRVLDVYPTHERALEAEDRLRASATGRRI
jgi:tetratricopeptide (TPR) repeat protein